MAKHRKQKYRQRKDKLRWVIPDYMPDCPSCDNDEFVDQLYDGSREFLCLGCGTVFKVGRDAAGNDTSKPVDADTASCNAISAVDFGKYQPSVLIEEHDNG